MGFLKQQYLEQYTCTSILSELLTALAGLCVVAALAGCTPREKLPPEVGALLETPEAGLGDSAVTGDNVSKPPVVEKCPVSEEVWIDNSRIPWTYAEVHYQRGGRIGYSTMTVTWSDIAEFKQLRIQRTDVLDRAPDGSPIPPREVTYEAYERPNGELASFRFLSSVDGKAELEVEGRMIFENLEVARKMEDTGLQRQKILWPEETWGPLGIQAVLMRSPMQPGQIRELQFYLPQMGQFIRARLEAIGHEITSLAGRSVAELLKVEVLIGTADSGVRSHIWTDENGVIQKSYTLTGEPILRVRVEENTVRRLADQSRYSRMAQQVISLSGKLENLAQLNPLTVEVQAIEFDPYSKFLKNNRQRVLSKGAGTCQIQTGSFDELDVMDEEPPGESLLSSSAIVPKESVLIAEQANQLLGSEPLESAQQIAIKLQVELHKQWKLNLNTDDIVSTLSAARSRSGGSFECASVLAALLRHRQIPARLVGGLFIDSATAKARFHVWTQAWIDDGWVDLDATTDQPVSTFHLAMTTSDASGDNPYQAWLPFLEILREIMDIRVL